ncbi:MULTISPECIES: putative baseplate assembly protein [Acidobacteriaceae]|uniref:putative baseplate assembly protein n=1 Tax=Acidobacteriaceae TaxID=204434 RepID=UPI00131D72E0|nr:MULTISPECIES: putative baseplate assembly protein [Acidobacteriaceae]MDW5265452.1 putative baseplate assembly protein [Edaphobacter sp.]
MSCTETSGTSGCTCGCCSGISIETPVGENNLPGLSAIAYRTGTWATFRESMLARLSSADYPALAYLTTRDTDDFSIALLDASSVVLDILTFYQERLANESYLRTATQLRSLTELARLINYQPAPGISAETYLAFTIKAATGLPSNPNTPAITIPAGTQVQNVPAQNQSPQYFETSADILAKADWNALPISTGQPWIPPGGDGIYLDGTTTQLNPGDSLLLLGIDREEWTPTSTPNEQWDVVTLNQVIVDTQNSLTWVGWDTRLTHRTGSGTSPATWTTAKVFAFRQKAALFGSTAPDPNLFVNAKTPAKTSLPGLIDVNTPTSWIWKNFTIASSSQIDLDTTYSKVVVDTWFALVASGDVQLYKVASVAPVARSGFAISAKITRLSADYTDSNIGTYFPLQATSVLAQSEELVIASQPFDYALYGAILDIDAFRPDLVGAQAVAITGKAQKLSVDTSASSLSFQPDDGSNPLALKPGDIVTLIDPSPLPLNTDGSIPDWIGSDDTRNLRVSDASGRTGTISASLSAFSLSPSSKSDPDIQEFALVSSVLAVNTPSPHTQILLESPLTNCYDRTMTTVNANVGLATAGRSVSEIMGSGSAATPNQSFVLRQQPLTYVQSPTPTGRLSTLQVRANGVAWKEVATLYQQKPSATVFSTLNQADSTTEVLFGDGVGNSGEGATLPTGQNNIQATYRIGSGAATNVAAATITTLIDRPLGVSGVINPESATGGQDPQSITDVRRNAPLSVLTLGRAVSITDYQNYAATFAGIAKAYAIWIPSGPSRGVFLTVAGAGGVALPPGNPTLGNLVTSLHNYGNPLIPLTVVTFLETLFSFSADVAYDPNYDSTVVEAAIVQSLRQKYSFACRSFGQGVSGDEIAAFIQAIPGVVAVNVKTLTVGATSAAGDLSSGNWSVYAYNQWNANPITLNRPSSGSYMRICPAIPVASPDSPPQPAEVLVLDPNPKAVALGVMA